MTSKRNAHRAEIRREILCQPNTRASHAEMPSNTIRLSGEITAQMIFEAIKKIVSIAVWISFLCALGVAVDAPNATSIFRR